MLTKEQVAEQIRAHRAFMKGAFGEEGFESDQMRQLPQPPLCKPPMGGAVTVLTRDFSGVVVEADYSKLIDNRRSRRVFGDGAVTLAELSFLLWTTQGVQSVRGKGYATLRPVPSGGARHGFETYLAVRNVDGLSPGVYHYLPLDHAVEYLGAVDDFEQTIADGLCGQKWAAKAAVVFYYSVVPYRCEWRYSHRSHKVALLDAGHVVQNLYLSCEAVGCGTCAVAAYDQRQVDAMLGLDGEEEFALYVAPVGRVE